MKKLTLWLMLALMLLTAGCGAQSTDAPAPPPKQETTVTETTKTPAADSQREIPAENTTPEPPAQDKAAEELPAESVPEEPAEETPAETIPEETEQLPVAEPVPEEPPQEEIPEEPAPEEPEAAPLTGPLPILMYHHVVPDGTDCNSMTVTAGKLEKDLQWLREHHYTPILPRDLVSGAPLPEKPVLITFDDGYRSNYELLFPLLQQYEMKAVISVMVYMQDIGVSSFLSWEMCREMAASGLVEIGSHTYRLHNLDERNGNFTQGGINGIQRKPDESDEDFRIRVLDDIQKSHDLLEAQLGTDATFFAYPFGLREADAEALIEELFPVTVVTLKGTAKLNDGVKNMPRFTVTEKTKLSSILKK